MKLGIAKANACELRVFLQALSGASLPIVHVIMH